MKQNEIIELAHKSGMQVQFRDGFHDIFATEYTISRFHELAVEAKREPLTIDQIRENYATAKVLDELEVEMSFADFVMLTRYFENLLT
jgi:hypothetical protein